MRRHRRAADSFGGGGLWPVGLGLLSLSHADVGGCDQAGVKAPGVLMPVRHTGSSCR